MITNGTEKYQRHRERDQDGQRCLHFTHFYLLGKGPLTYTTLIGGYSMDSCTTDHADTLAIDTNGHAASKPRETARGRHGDTERKVPVWCKGEVRCESLSQVAKAILHRDSRAALIVSRGSGATVNILKTAAQKAQRQTNTQTNKKRLNIYSHEHQRCCLTSVHKYMTSSHTM